MSQYNLRNPAVKRLMKEAEELRFPTDEYHAQPLEDNLFEWHFTLRGPSNSDFEDGVYHGRITLPPDYPMKPPSIILLTPNGRFETNKKICLSISGHHPESWQPSWSIRTALLAIIGFMPTHGNGAIGSLDYSPEERQLLAKRSQEWKCAECGSISDVFCKGRVLRTKSEDNQVSVTSSNITLDEPESQPMLSNDLKAENRSIDTVPLPSDNLSAREGSNELVHRVKQRPTEEVNNNSSERNEFNGFYSVAFWGIISIIVYLIFRRLFLQ